MEKAQQFEEEDGEHDEPRHHFAPTDYAYVGNADYDSDDPRSLGGLYYWDLGAKRPLTLATRVYDWFRLLAYHMYRACEFAFLVFRHFFGFQSRFQWAVDLLEREESQMEEEAVERTNAGRKE
jgi:hypothetical protein